MTLNVLGLIKSIGEPFDALIADQLVPATKKIKSNFSGDDERHLDMKREGVCLTFERESRRLQSVLLVLRIEDKPSYVFPNILPNPLIQNMTLQWIRENIGDPIYSQEPIKILRRWQGRTEQFNLLKSDHGSISMLVNYNMENEVEEVVFTPEKNVFFRFRDGDHSEWLERRGPLFED